MSDLFKRNAPRMTDDEDRRTWERVRAAAARPVPWWAVLWARPAARFGLPALAVALVAIVWVAVEQPASTRVPARSAAATVPAPALQQAPTTERAPATPNASPPPAVVTAPAPPPAAPARQKDERFALAPERHEHDQKANAPSAPPSAPRAGASVAMLRTAGDANEVRSARKEVAGIVQEEAAPATPAPAPAPAAGGASALNKTRAVERGITDGATLGSTAARPQALAGRAMVAHESLRGGRADELSTDAGPTASILAAVSAAIVRRPLEFSAPFPVALAGGGAPETARIDLDGTGKVHGRLVVAGAPDSGAPVVAPVRTYDRFADAGQAERILLVAYEADRAAGTNQPAVAAVLTAEARKLVAEPGPEHAAALALAAHLPRTPPPGP